jgi:hypothetical protein
VSKIGIGFVVFPFSWKLGPWVREKKTIYALGPLRFVVYKSPGEWKPNEALEHA